MAADPNRESNEVFPGGKIRYRELLASAQENTDDAIQPMLDMAAELAGLAYILDGIRYSLRQGK
jgi:hypothetical protein